ncbi:Major facilitator superfamily domain general substrate transporter [Penicillium capsulatum]|uniref:Major facilitator superfamily domain general substrate transporter n=1 Tax=Penicillium capsulatum TaxID=69766 RepID=A0A9W9LFT7_9EURO|nr:Major facilitator superfamily domain general substrate transporter [Penicillium capsulatum]KAJ6114158.1 Major facilitator superfamily domain general substrate transporter [Penicillium capsulatum]
MTRGNARQSKVYYKGRTEDFVIFVADITAVQNRKKYHTLPLAQVMDGWKIFTSHQHGPQGMQLALVFSQRGHLAFFDAAYPGFASGDLDTDLEGVRLFAELEIPLVFVSTYGKSFGLYSERVGILSVLVPNEDVGKRIEVQLRLLARAELGAPPGALADFWGPVERAIAISLFSAATFVGPIFGPIVGGFIVESHLGWRWTAWITMIPASFFGIIALSCPRHTILSYFSAAPTTSVKRRILTKYLLRPLQMLFLEPILVCMTIYISLIYGILYLFFVAYLIAFRHVRGWGNEGVAALPFLGILVGVLLGCLVVTVATRLWYAPKVRKGTVVPEDRLPPMILAAFLLPIGLFWFAWTSKPEIA